MNLAEHETRIDHVLEDFAAGILPDGASPAARGAATFSIHPLQTIPDGETDLRGTPCAAAADPLAIVSASSLPGSRKC